MSIPEPVLRGVMDQAVLHSIQHVENGGIPFVGVVATDAGAVSVFGVNQVRNTQDPTAHAEIIAMRDALAGQRRDDLTGTVLLATGEPCGLCYRFAIDHGISDIYVALDRDVVATWGFDYRASYQALGITDEIRSTLYHPLPVDAAEEPFRRFHKTLTDRQ